VRFLRTKEQKDNLAKSCWDLFKITIAALVIAPFTKPETVDFRSLNQTAKDWHTRVVTLSEVKGLKDRFFATLRMTVPNEYIVKCTNVMHSGLVLGLSIETFFAALGYILDGMEVRS
jgi:hypothetical protein